MAEGSGLQYYTAGLSLKWCISASESLEFAPGTM